MRSSAIGYTKKINVEIKQESKKKKVSLTTSFMSELYPFWNKLENPFSSPVVPFDVMSKNNLLRLKLVR